MYMYMYVTDSMQSAMWVVCVTAIGRSLCIMHCIYMHVYRRFLRGKLIKVLIGKNGLCHNVGGKVAAASMH